jgi:hypothetical protein
MIFRASIFNPQLPRHGIGLTFPQMPVKCRTDPFMTPLLYSSPNGYRVKVFYAGYPENLCELPVP